MRGNPILRTVLLAVAMCLTSVLVAAVIGKTRRPPLAVETPALAPPSTALVPTYLTVTLSTPAKSLTLTEPSGRTISVPTEDGLTLELEVELSVSKSAWEGRLSLEWEDPSRHNFLRLDFEPDNLKSSHLLLDFHRNADDHPIMVDFNPN